MGAGEIWHQAEEVNVIFNLGNVGEAAEVAKVESEGRASGADVAAEEPDKVGIRGG